MSETSRPTSRGFTLIEVLACLTIIGLLSGAAMVSMNDIKIKARDTKRKADLAQLGRLIALSCYRSDAGRHDYDLAQIKEDVLRVNPQLAGSIIRLPVDPRNGTDQETGYRYAVSEDGQKCAIYANLEAEDEAVTLTGVNASVPGGGIGVYKGSVEGRNGTDRYFQVSN